MITRRVFGLLISLLAGAAWTAPSQAATPDEAREIARQAYVYGYAPIANYGTWYKQAVDAKAPEYVGGFNVFRNYAEPFTAANHDVVTPNNDTPYSWTCSTSAPSRWSSACRRFRKTATTSCS